MWRSERSIAVPTGMIIAALYVVLLVGFSRESYMRRDAASRAIAARSPEFRGAPSRTCRVGLQGCEALIEASIERDQCVAPEDVLRRLESSPLPPLTVLELQRALGAEQ